MIRGPGRDNFSESRVMIFNRIFLSVFLLIFMTGVVVTFILPEVYAGTARVSANAEVSKECQVIQSDTVLTQAINALKLDSRWGRQYNGGASLTMSNTLSILRRRLAVAPESGSALIDIKVFSEDPNEAAEIANAIAGACRGQLLPAKPGLVPDRIAFVERASPSQAPVKPNKPLDISLGAAIGILAGAMVAGIASQLDSRSRGR